MRDEEMLVDLSELIGKCIWAQWTAGCTEALVAGPFKSALVEEQLSEVQWVL